MRAYPWYERGGMSIYEHGAAVNIFVPPFTLALRFLSSELMSACWFATWIAIIVYQFRTTVTPERKKLQPYLHLCLPVYAASLAFVAVAEAPLRAAAATAALVVAKVGLCMSVCLHRYAAHGAFKCGWLTNIGLCLFGCLANQGGPIWWGSKHRCHHTFCDGERDPHSPLIAGCIDAFQFHTLKAHKATDEEFRPHHADACATRLIDTFSFVPVTLELVLGYMLGGPGGLWVCYASGVLSQVLALWFNVVNHPYDARSADHPCASRDSTNYFIPVEHQTSMAPNLLFSAVNTCVWVGQLTGEAAHDHHHDHASLARRPGVDLPFHLMVRPLQALGLIWAVKLPKAA
jgi:fatty-acid desaturase